tara:strand:- start:172014 stop:172454 length:441 start_codon:yes stop_codon:yes gene_type:complete
MKRHNIFNRRAEELMKKIFEKQGIGEVNLAVKETEVVKTEEEGWEDERDFDMDIKDAQEIYDEVEQALEAILGDAMTESIMEKIEDDIKDFAMAIAEERDAKMEEIKKSKIAATQEEINSLKAKLEAIKNDEAEVVEETDDTSEDK